MSFSALVWAFRLDQTEITDSEFRVLANLCDITNEKKGCFPSQAVLCEKTNKSNGGLNKILNSLERKNLIKRVRRNDPHTKHRKTTVYFLRFEFDPDEECTGSSDSRPNSTIAAMPTPPEDGIQLHVGGDAIKNEPVKKPVRLNCAPPSGALNSDIDLGKMFDQFWSTHPRPHGEAKTRKLLSHAVRCGADPNHILHSARVYANEQKGNESRFIKRSDNWLKEKNWECYKPRAHSRRPAEQTDTSLAQSLKSGKRYLCNSISMDKVIDLIRRDLVTFDEVRQVDLITVAEGRAIGLVA